MHIEANMLVPMAEASQNFSKVAKLVDESGTAIILKNDKPCYMVLSFDEYSEIRTMRQNRFDETADKIINENMEALLELSKC